MKIGIINAMHKEHEQIALLLEEKKEKKEGRLTFIEGTLYGNTIILMESGIGKVNAAIGALELIRCFEPNCLVNTGVAGGIDAKLKVMDVVAGERVAYHDVDCGPETAAGQVQGLPLFYEANSMLYHYATAIQTETTIHGGLICSGDQFITNPLQLAAIKAKFPEGLAVDMESGAIAQVCYLYNVPFLSFRIISDTPGTDHHFDQYLNFWDTMAEKSFKITKAFIENVPEVKS